MSQFEVTGFLPGQWTYATLPPAADFVDVRAITEDEGIVKSDGSTWLIAATTPLVTIAFTVSPAAYESYTYRHISPTVLSSMRITTSLFPTADWDADELTEFRVIAEAGAGFIDFTISRPGPIVGDFIIGFLKG